MLHTHQATIADFVADNAIVTRHYQQILGNLLQLFLTTFRCTSVPPWLSNDFMQNPYVVRAIHP